MLSQALFLVICGIGVTAYLLGKAVGKDRGYTSGYMVGHREGQQKWIKAMEFRRSADGSLRPEDRSALISVRPTNRQTS